LKYLIDNEYVERNSSYDWVIGDDAYILTPKGLSAVKSIPEEFEQISPELWWDLYDTSHDSLSDDIHNDNKILILEKARRDGASEEEIRRMAADMNIDLDEFRHGAFVADLVNQNFEDN
jgi:hypothetical protein